AMTIVVGTRQLPPGRAPGGGEENADLRALASGIFCHLERQSLYLQPAGDGAVGGLEFGVDPAEQVLHGGDERRRRLERSRDGMDGPQECGLARVPIELLALR